MLRGQGQRGCSDSANPPRRFPEGSSKLGQTPLARSMLGWLRMATRKSQVTLTSLDRKLDASVERLAAKVDMSVEQLDKKIDTLDFKVDGSIARLDAKLDVRFDETQRHARVLNEETKQEIRQVAEGVAALDEKFDLMLKRLPRVENDVELLKVASRGLDRRVGDLEHSDGV